MAILLIGWICTLIFPVGLIFVMFRYGYLVDNWLHHLDFIVCLLGSIGALVLMCLLVKKKIASKLD
jgi:hypothetical protein